MKKIALICSHDYSGSSQLYDAMTENPRIHGCRGDKTYANMEDFYWLSQNEHKIRNNAGVFIDELLSNMQLRTKEAYGLCKFVYVVRSPEQVINYMVVRKNIRADYAARAYLFRIRRLCEMAKRTPGAVLLTYDDLREGRGIDLIEEHLCLKEPIKWRPASLAPVSMRLSPANFAPEALAQVEEGWERYLYFLKNQSLRMPR